jgi:hypothetical protein
MSKTIDIKNTVTGDLYPGVVLEGTFNLGGKLACFNGKLVNGFKEVQKEKKKPQLVVEEEPIVDIYDGVPDDIMYTEPSDISMIKDRDEILEFCDKMQLGETVDMNHPVDEIIKRILDVRSEIKRRRMVKV